MIERNFLIEKLEEIEQLYRTAGDSGIQAAYKSVTRLLIDFANGGRGNIELWARATDYTNKLLKLANLDDLSVMKLMAQADWCESVYHSRREELSRKNKIKNKKQNKKGKQQNDMITCTADKQGNGSDHSGRHSNTSDLLLEKQPLDASYLDSHQNDSTEYDQTVEMFTFGKSIWKMKTDFWERMNQINDELDDIDSINPFNKKRAALIRLEQKSVQPLIDLTKQLPNSECWLSAMTFQKAAWINLQQLQLQIKETERCKEQLGNHIISGFKRLSLISKDTQSIQQAKEQLRLITLDDISGLSWHERIQGRSLCSTISKMYDLQKTYSEKDFWYQLGNRINPQQMEHKIKIKQQAFESKIQLIQDFPQGWIH